MKMNVIKLLGVFFLAASCNTALSQISPPGLDDTHAALWMALGVSQKISDHWNVTLYAGGARKSNPDNISPVEKSAIFVINQETLYTFNPHWSVALCTSYRTQNQYEEAEPYDKGDPAVKKEVRYYSRIYFKENVHKLGVALSFRPEYRTYFAERHHWNPIDSELRFRLKAQVSVPLGKSNTNQFILSEEILTATDHTLENHHPHWTSYAFTEDRFATFFRHVFKQPSIVTDLGVMHQVRADGKYIAHLSFDVIFQNLL